MELFREEFRLFLTEGKGDIEKILSHYANHTPEQIAENTEKLCAVLKPDKAAHFIVTKLFPTLLLPLGVTAKNTLITVATVLIEKYPIKILSIPQIKAFKTQIKKSYVEQINAIRKAQDASWSKIWMLLIRYLQEHLHNDVEFANSLFRIVEAAFRTSCDRMGSYDCWKELIRNYQHNETFIKSSKHIKLLVTPLKVRLSGSEHLIYKRFEVWVFLLKALKENAIEVLDAYLGFCFGGTEGEQQGKSGKSVNTGLGKSCTVIWEEATEVMLEIMGHRKLCENSKCWESEIGHEFHSAVVNAKNFNTCYSIVIHSVIECTLLLEKWADETTQKQVIHCLWSTLFALTKNLEGEAAVAAENQIYTFLASCVPAATKQVMLQKHIMLSILEMNSKHMYIIIKNILASKQTDHEEHLLNLLKLCSETKEKSKFLKLGILIFSDFSYEWNQLFFREIWLFYFNFFDPSDHVHVHSTEAAILFIAFILNVDSNEGLKNDKQAWCELFKKFCAMKPGFENIYITEAVQVMNSKISHKKNMAPLVTFMIEASGKDTEKYEFTVVQRCWDILCFLLDSSLEDFATLKEITGAMQTLLLLDLKKFPEQEQIKLAQKIAKCVLIMLTKYKIYTILDQVEVFVKSLSFPLKIAVGHILQEKLMELSNCTFVETASKAIQIYQTILCKKRIETPTIDLSRGARLTNMARNSLDSLLNNNQKKGSLKKSLQEVQKVKEFPTVFGKPEKEEFVVINTEVKFDKTKLSARQKEHLKKRRDDIPSLYMDLTQDSQSESVSLNSIDVAAKETYDNESKEKRYITRRSLSLGDKNKQQKQTEKDVVDKSCAETESIVPESNSEVLSEKSLSESVGLVEENKDEVRTSSPVTDADTETEANAVSEEEVETQGKEGKAKDVKPRKKGRRRKKQFFNISPNVAVTTIEEEKESKKQIPLTEEEKELKRQISIKRELRRLKIDAKIEAEMLTSRTGPSKSRRSSRWENKIEKDKQTPSPPKSTENNNTEVIESSQESIISIKPSSHSISDETKKETEMETESCNDDTQVETQSIVDLQNEQDATSTETEICEAKRDTESCDPYEPISIEMEVQVDAPRKPTINDFDQTVVAKETDSLSSNETENLPSSPVTVETPTRTSELLLNTSDISPIRSSNEILTLKQKTLEDYVQSPTNRSAKLLSLVSNSNSLKINDQSLTDSVPVAVLGNRSKKIMESLTKQVETTTTPLLSREENFLTFSRELPSSSAVPAGGSILKRKKPDFSDDNSPCVKRKRVNFPDPPTTSEKLISNEEDKNENKPKIKGKLVKRCKKQLDMNTIKYDFVMMYDNETDSDNNLEVGTPEPLPLNGLPEDTEFLRNNSTVDLVGLENVMDNKKDSVKMSADAFIDAIHNLDKENEEHMTLMKETFRRVEAAMPPSILAEIVFDILNNRQ